ncbi:MAG TPA: SRPBCC family protein [Streptosporangiaceae bacterium]|nr:SRPBCC family protein [Streptosporangiaceae bacterium]
MPTRLTIAAGVLVSGTPQEVWDLAVDWSRQREWIWATRVDGGHGPGARVTGWTGIGPIGFTDTMVITEWDPPRRCAVTHTGKLVRGSGVLEVLPRGSQAEFRWVERLVLPLPPALGKLAAAVIGPAARLGLGSSLYRFARLLPAETPSRPLADRA